ncbi:hypothetical protein SKAU_G00059440 [Synaphobranchus kaupii]|uniref:Reverse transcriptase domain-containing protein n=1 Tax=Synaphobranchus kaupii TaxID=118154 RepID=A0A9Q1G4K0_SYNKA|nr:hypothetical protein SKAU_G00059440 [Synaphobranchus kaupii]
MLSPEMFVPLRDFPAAKPVDGAVPEKNLKITWPPTFEELRPISLTPQLSKLAEGYVAEWIWQDIEEHLDPQQYGCRKGRSTTDALTSLLDVLHRSTDKIKTSCTLVVTDFSKAFDKINHTIAANCLIDLGVRLELIPWVIDFMTDQKQRVRYQGCMSA